MWQPPWGCYPTPGYPSNPNTGNLLGQPAGAFHGGGFNPHVSSMGLNPPQGALQDSGPGQALWQTSSSTMPMRTLTGGSYSHGHWCISIFRLSSYDLSSCSSSAPPTPSGGIDFKALEDSSIYPEAGNYCSDTQSITEYPNTKFTFGSYFGIKLFSLCGTHTYFSYSFDTYNL